MTVDQAIETLAKLRDESPDGGKSLICAMVGGEGFSTCREVGFRRCGSNVFIGIEVEWSYEDALRGEAERLEREYLERIRSIKDVIKMTSSLISRELQNASIVMWPNVGSLYLKRIELVKVRAEAVLAVLVTMTNAVKNYIIKLDRKLDDVRLEHVANYINANYGDFAISRIAADLKQAMRDKDEDITGLSKVALNVIDSIVEQDLDNDIYWDGLEYFMNEPEFRDLDVTKRFFQIFSDKKDLISLMQSELPFRDLRIYIGKENRCDRFRDCSIITSGYELQGRTIGRFGVIGPKRMNYDNALRTLGCLSDLISEKLEEINQAE